jgi:UDP-N-acetylmuramoyl-tripeptide--D-alanyl-D-alanine ligase
MGFWTTEKIANSLGLKIQNSSKDVSEITTDSRQVKPGSVFVAIKGDTHDGHAFIAGAIAAGAVAIISETQGFHPRGGEFFNVSSTMASIRSLASTYRKSFSVPFIGIVGAVGKTTTKELFSSILTGKFSHVSKTIGSQNGFLGIPITLLAVPENSDAVVVEIGIDDIGAMDEHMQLVAPTHLILTKTGPEHLHQLKTVEIAAEEELKAFDYALAHALPLAINLSDEFVNPWFQKNQKRVKSARFLTYSLEKSLNPEFLGDYDAEKSELAIHSKTLNAQFVSPLPGVHHAHNLLASIVLSQFFDLSIAEIKKGLASFKTAFGRTEIYKLPNDIEVIGDYYNSNPTSLDAALSLLSSVKGKSAYHAVLGDMLELGDAEKQFHKDAAGSLEKNKITHAWLYGERMKWLKEELEKRGFKSVRHFSTHDELISALKPSLEAHSRVLIKGSRGMKMEKALNALIPTESKAH